MSLSDELKHIATDVYSGKSKRNAASIAEILKIESRQAALEGKFFLHIRLRERGWGFIDAEVAAVELRHEGFQVQVGNEIVAWYSNTDYDSENYIKVSWQ